MKADPPDRQVATVQVNFRMTPKELTSELYFPISFGASRIRKIFVLLGLFLGFLIAPLFFWTGLNSALYYQAFIFLLSVSLTAIPFACFIVLRTFSKATILIQNDSVCFETLGVCVSFEDLGPAWLNLEKPILPTSIHYGRYRCLSIGLKNSKKYRDIAPDGFSRFLLRAVREPKKPLPKERYYNWCLPSELSSKEHYGDILRSDVEQIYHQTDSSFLHFFSINLSVSELYKVAEVLNLIVLAQQNSLEDFEPKN